MMLFAKIRKLMTSTLWIQTISKTRLICFSVVLPLPRGQLFDLQRKWNDWSLFNGNFGLKWVEIFYFYSYTILYHNIAASPLIELAALNVALIRNIITF